MRIGHETEDGKTSVYFYKKDPDGKESWIDPDRYSFFDINTGKSGGSVWESLSYRLSGHYSAKATKDGALKRTQTARGYFLGFIPAGGEKAVLKMSEKNGVLEIEKKITGMDPITCYYENVNQSTFKGTISLGQKTGATPPV